MAKGSKQDLLNNSIFLAPIINVAIVSWMVNYFTTVTFTLKMTPQQNEMEKYEANCQQSVIMSGVIDLVAKHAELSLGHIQ